MKYKWLNKLDNKKLIVFFNGWGMDENVVKHLVIDGFDLVMFYDYSNLDTDFNFQALDKYEETHLVAWSMGVMIGTLFASKLKTLVSSTAINGTLTPIDIENGIHPRIYDLTIRGFNEAGRDKFVSNMGLQNGDYKGRNDSIESLKNELIAIKNYKADEDFKYDKVLISNNDKIIPTKNQVNYWKQNPNMECGHAPFYIFKKWSEIL
jgi:biotin synthesis protein BioG